MAVPDQRGRGNALRVVQVPGKGRGLVAGRRLTRDEVVDDVPVIVIPRREWQMVEQTVIAKYVFGWDDRTGSMALAIGRVSLLNHSYEPNLAAEKRVASRIIRFTALQDIPPGEELTIDYHGDAACRDPLGFEVQT